MVPRLHPRRITKHNFSPRPRVARRRAFVQARLECLGAARGAAVDHALAARGARHRVAVRTAARHVAHAQRLQCADDSGSLAAARQGIKKGMRKVGVRVDRAQHAGRDDVAALARRARGGAARAAPTERVQRQKSGPRSRDCFRRVVAGAPHGGVQRAIVNGARRARAHQTDAPVQRGVACARVDRNGELEGVAEHGALRQSEGRAAAGAHHVHVVGGVAGPVAIHGPPIVRQRHNVTFALAREPHFAEPRAYELSYGGLAVARRRVSRERVRLV